MYLYELESLRIIESWFLFRDYNVFNILNEMVCVFRIFCEDIWVFCINGVDLFMLFIMKLGVVLGFLKWF